VSARVRCALAVLAALGAGWAAASGGQTARAQSRPDRTTPPVVEPAPPLTLPPIQKRALSNGLPVWIVELHEVPLAQVSLVVHAGSGDDPPGQFGLASMTAAMLDEGAGTRSALDIADAVEFLGATLSTSSSFDASAIRLNVPVRQLPAALPVMADVARRPTVPAAELDRLRQERLTDILQARDDAATVAGPAFARVVFGATHRYGTPANGTTATIKAFTPAQLRAFHAVHYRPSNATLIVAGDVTPASIVPLLEQSFGSWTAGATDASRAATPEAPQLSAGQVTIVDLPSAEQSQIRIGWVGVPRATPDYFALQVLNTVLGGSFTSRLNQNLREEHGYTYGASSRFDMRRSAGPFAAGAGVQTDKTSESLREFFKELNAIGNAISADELSKAKNYLALGFPADFETIGDLAARLEEMAVYRLPDTYYADYVGRIQAVSAAEVRRVAAVYIQPSKFAVVVVGDRQTIEPGIRKLGLAPVRAMSVEEVLP
jgi:predicted Zn-dependent peptidase